MIVNSEKSVLRGVVSVMDIMQSLGLSETVIRKSQIKTLAKHLYNQIRSDKSIINQTHQHAITA